MGKTYARNPKNASKAAKAHGEDLRVSFKNTRETAQAINGMKVVEARQYLENVMAHSDVIPFRRYRYGVGRAAQGKKYKVTQARWPEKSCKFILGLLQNVKSNAEVKGLEVESLKITHVQVNKAPKGRRRTYRAHGRISAYLSHPCHVEIIAESPDENAPKAEDGGERKAKRVAKERITAGTTAGHA